jgi:hypothetical protein
MIPDLINGLFELSGSLVLWRNVFALRRDREVKGIHVSTTLFFFWWGIWNLWYYPHLGQWFSFLGGLSIVIANAVWVGLALYYRRPSVVESSHAEKAHTSALVDRLLAEADADPHTRAGERIDYDPDALA